MIHTDVTFFRLYLDQDGVFSFQRDRRDHLWTECYSFCVRSSCWQLASFSSLMSADGLRRSRTSISPSLPSVYLLPWRPLSRALRWATEVTVRCLHAELFCVCLCRSAGLTGLVWSASKWALTPQHAAVMCFFPPSFLLKVLEKHDKGTC